MENSRFTTSDTFVTSSIPILNGKIPHLSLGKTLQLWGKPNLSHINLKDVETILSILKEHPQRCATQSQALEVVPLRKAKS